MADLTLKITQSGDWRQVRDLLEKLKRGGRVWESVVAKEAKHAAGLVKKNLVSQGKLAGTKWPPASKLTALRKRSKKLLIESGQLSKSIGHVQSGNTWFVGVVSSEAHKGSKISLDALARVHEYGVTIVQQWTAKQRRAFFALLRKYGASKRAGAKKAGQGARTPTPRDGRTGRFKAPKAAPAGAMTVVIKIPARPFIFPVLNKLYRDSQDAVERRILARVKSALKLK